MLLNVVTPCVRKENLKALAQSLRPDLVLIRWLIVFDKLKLDPSDEALVEELRQEFPIQIEAYAAKRHWSVSGNAQRNVGLDAIKEGYVYFLDDDNIVHPAFWETLTRVMPTGKAFVGQQLIEGDLIRQAAPHHVKVNHIDAAQCCIPISVIGKNRWKEEAYTADGLFIGYVYHLKHAEFVFVEKVIAYYNYLTGSRAPNDLCHSK